MKLTKELIDGMVKYINTMYSPKRIETITTGSTYQIDLYFNENDEKFIKNPLYHTSNDLKVINIGKLIKSDIYVFFGVYSSGLDFMNFSQYKDDVLNINVIIE